MMKRMWRRRSTGVYYWMGAHPEREVRRGKGFWQGFIESQDGMHLVPNGVFPTKTIAQRSAEDWILADRLHR